MKYSKKQMQALTEILPGIPLSAPSGVGIYWEMDTLRESFSCDEFDTDSLDISYFENKENGYEKEVIEFWKAVEFTMTQNLSDILHCQVSEGQCLINAIIAWRYQIGK